MKLLMGWTVSAGLVFGTLPANAQLMAPYEIGPSPYTTVSDVGGRYGAVPPALRGGPALLPPPAVSIIARESGFSPLGIPQQRGVVYTVSVIDRGGDDGRLVIDARSGRIIRFVPAYRMGDDFDDDLTVTYGAVGPLPPFLDARRAPRPPRSIPHVASRTPPMPKPAPLLAKRAAPPAQQSAAMQNKPAETSTPGQAVTTGSAGAKPAPQIAPTKEMPPAQGLD